MSSTLFYKHIFFSSTKRDTLCSYIHVCETSGKLLTITTNQSHLGYLSGFFSLIGIDFRKLAGLGSYGSFEKGRGPPELASHFERCGGDVDTSFLVSVPLASLRAWASPRSPMHTEWHRVLLEG